MGKAGLPEKGGESGELRTSFEVRERNLSLYAYQLFFSLLSKRSQHVTLELLCGLLRTHHMTPAVAVPGSM